MLVRMRKLRFRIALLAVIGAVGLALGVVALSPLGEVIASRAAHGHSDRIRGTLTARAVDAANASPILGFGGNRSLVGSNKSIAIGRRPGCAQCGNRDVGSDGQFGNLLIGQGWVGLACYNGFFLWVLWAYRRNRSTVGIAASTVIVLLLWFQFLYGSLATTLAYAMISVAILARPGEAGRPSPVPDPGPGSGS